jgi:hypothetical protein
MRRPKDVGNVSTRLSVVLPMTVPPRATSLLSKRGRWIPRIEEPNGMEARDMDQQIIAPVAKRSPMLPLAVALIAALAYGGGVITTALVASNVIQPSSAGHAAPIVRTIDTHRITAGSNKY